MGIKHYLSVRLRHLHIWKRWNDKKTQKYQVNHSILTKTLCNTLSKRVYIKTHPNQTLVALKAVSPTPYSYVEKMVTADLGKRPRCHWEN